MVRPSSWLCAASFSASSSTPLRSILKSTGNTGTSIFE